MTRHHPLKRTRLKPKKRKAAKAWRFIADLVFELADHRCCARSDRCTGIAEHPHHRLPKGRGGPDTFPNCLPVCWACHTFIHRDGQTWAEENDFLLTRQRAAKLNIIPAEEATQ